LTLSGLPAEANSHILAKAEGNPFYLEEVLRSLIDLGLIIREAGVWRAVPGLSVRNIPDTVHGVIATRMDRLGPEVKSLLQMASVIGRNFDVPVLERLADMDPMMMSLELATLEECEFILKKPDSGPEPGTEYAFKHPLVQEVAYNSLPRRYRSDLHQRVAETMERVYPNIHEEYPEILAYHYASSDNVGQAVQWLTRAGRKSMDRYANEEAIQHFERIVSLIGGSSGQPQVHTAALTEAYEALGDLYALTGVYGKAISRFEALKDTVREPARQATALRKTAIVHFKQSNYATALKIMAEAEGLIAGDQAGARYEQAEIAQSRGSIYASEGRLAEARREGESALQILDGIGDDARADGIRSQCLNNLGAVYRQQGDINRAVETLQKSIGILEKRDLKKLMGKTLNQLAVIYQVKGDSQRALEFNERALKIMEEIGDKMMIGGIYGNFGVIYTYLGQTDRALECHKKQSAIAEEIGDKRGLGIAFNNLGRIYAMRPESHDQALESFQRAQEILEEIGDQMSACAALGNLAIIHFQHGDPGLAEKYLLRTEQILTALGNKELLINTYNYLSQVQLAKKSGVDEALRYADKVMALADAINSEAGRADAHRNYSLIYLEAGDLAKAMEHFEKAIVIHGRIGRRGYLIQDYRIFAQKLKDFGYAELADRYFREAEKLEAPAK
jgi:tetratricopeptide (TPR) repeat protein